MLPASCVKTGEIVSMLHACCVKPPVSQQSREPLLVGHLTSMVFLLPGLWPDGL